MSSKLWFLTDGSNLLGVFDSRHEAEREDQKYQDDPDYEYFETYSLEIDDLEDYPDEYEIAQEFGYLD